MRSNTAVAKAVAVVACGLMTAAALSPAEASEYAHPAPTAPVAATWTPNLVETPGHQKPLAYAIGEAGTDMVVGGRFQAVENSTRTVQYPRQNVFAFSATNGAINPGFAPQVDGVVWSVHSDGTSVYIGGGFKTVNGTARPALAKLDLATGQLDTAFQPAFKGRRVSDIDLVDGRLIVAGTFTRRLMALDPTTGKASNYIPQSITGRLPASNSAQVFKFDISPDGQRLVAVGNFLAVDGVDRPRVFMLDFGAAAATLSDWNYPPLARKCSSGRVNAQSYVQDVDFAPDSSWFSLASFGYMYEPDQRGLMLCDSVSRFETNSLSPVKPTWINYTGGDSLKSVEVTGAAVYVQGHSRWLDNPYGQDSKGVGAVDRLGGGAVDPITGMALANWAPTGGMPQQSGGYDITSTEAGVWFATDGKRFGNKYRRGIRFTPLP